MGTLAPSHEFPQGLEAEAGFQTGSPRVPGLVPESEKPGTGTLLSDFLSLRNNDCGGSKCGKTNRA